MGAACRRQVRNGGSRVMKTAALIRCVAIDEESQRLAEQLEPWFGTHVYFVQDCYGEFGLPIQITGRAIRVTRSFLERDGLPWFSKVGWQCGDFMFYAGAEALPQYDRFWMIEPDVYFNLDVRDFFAQLEDVDVDFLGSTFRESPPRGKWYPSGQALGASTVWKSLFPLGRLTRGAITHLHAARREYSARSDIASLHLETSERRAYANDEVFVSTVLMRDGFSCQSIRGLMPKAFRGSFGTLIQSIDIDKDLFRDHVLHPFCDPIRARKKIRIWANSGKNIEALLRFRDDIVTRHGAEVWARYCDLDLP